jgi:hypothetical protein
VDPKRTNDILIQNSYKTIYRYKLRQEFEIQCRKLLLQKANRSDILSGEAHLSETELKKLEELDQILRQLSIQVMRIDGMLMKLRDY